MEYLKGVLDEIFGEHSSHEKDLIFEAVKKDNNESSKVTGRASEIIPMINEIFGKQHRVMSPKVMNRYKLLLKTYSIDDMRKAFTNAKNNDYHRESSYFYCTPEYFSRPEQMDKWATFDPRQTKIFDGKSNFSNPIL